MKMQDASVALFAMLVGCNSSWIPNDSACKDPFIVSSVPVPYQASSSDFLSFSASVYSTCPSQVLLTFPEYDTSVHAKLPYYDANLEGLVLERIEDAEYDKKQGSVYQLYAVPLTSFSLGPVRYTVSVFSGMTEESQKKNSVSLDSHFIVENADTGG